MKPTWEIQKDYNPDSDAGSIAWKCLICGRESLSIEDEHLNMRLVKCPTCKQKVWVPKCPSGCPSFKEKTK
jgi:DNA-directed RNA polymerase subunit RPC12/RpoP